MVHSCRHWCPQADTHSLQGGQSSVYVNTWLDRVMLDTKEILWKNRRIRCTVQYGALRYNTEGYSRGEESRGEGGEYLRGLSNDVH